MFDPVKDVEDRADDVIVLTTDNFDKMVMQSEDAWIVEFYAPWCGFCKSLEPEYKVAAKMLKGKVKVGKVNCDDEPNLKARFEVSGFPTIKAWEAEIGNKMDQASEEYQGGRLGYEIRDFGLTLINEELKD